MEGGEVTSTSENDTQVSPCEESAIVDPSKKPVEVHLSKVEDEAPADDSQISFQGTKFNGDLNDENLASPKTLDSSNHDDNICESISSSGPIVCSNEVTDSAVTSSELCDGAKIDTEKSDEVSPLPTSSEIPDSGIKVEVVEEGLSLPACSEQSDIAKSEAVKEGLSLPTSPEQSNVALKNEVVKEGLSLPTSSEQSDIAKSEAVKEGLSLPTSPKQSDEAIKHEVIEEEPSLPTSSGQSDIALKSEAVKEGPSLPTSSEQIDVAIKNELVKEGPSLPTSSEQSDEMVKPKMGSETQHVAISSPTVSATSTSSPMEQISLVTCTKTDKPELSVESFQLTNQSDIAKKEALLLVEKLALNSSITVSRKESKPESDRAEPVPEGRVLRLRPTPKTEPPKTTPKPSPKPTDGRKTSTSSNSGADKSSNKTPKGQKRKYDEAEGDLYDKSTSVSIQYKGYKKVASVREPVKKSIIKFNPFNPAFRRECTRVPSQVLCSNFDSPHQDQQEYAQYLGLQPLVKFRCSNCGMSSFQTMNALNAHKAECTKSIGVTNQGQSMKLPFSTGQLDTSQSEPKSTNIKLTRKVFLCSACGTYYELWNLFLHMREAHRRYICLECLGMSSSPEKLSEHLKQKHGVISQTFDDPEKFSPSILPQAYYLMCIHCDKIYSEEDKFTTHKCPSKKGEIESSTSLVKNPVVSSQTQTSDPPKSSAEAVQTVPSSNAKLPLRRTREATKKATKLAQQKKEVEVLKTVIQKELEEALNEPSIPAAGLSEPVKPELEQSDADAVPSIVTGDTGLPEPPIEVKKEEPTESNIPPTPPSAIEDSEAISADHGEHEEFSSPTEDLSKANNETVRNVELEPVETPQPYSVATEPVAAPPYIPSSTIPVHPAVVPITPGNTKNVKRGSRKPARRKRPLAFKPRSRKPKHVPVPVQMLNPSGLLPNPLNSIHYSPPEQTDDASEGRDAICDQAAGTAVDTPKEPSQEFMNKLPLQFKFKLNPEMDNEGDSDDSQKLSLVVDESANNSDAETKSVGQKEGYEDSVPLPQIPEVEDSKEVGSGNEITLAGDEIQPMALALEDKIENVPIQAVLKECVRTSCLSCNYCRHAHKIAVNGKYLALHLLSEHRYLPIKNETPDDVINKLKNSLEELENMCFNTETYDNTDVSIHVPYDQDTTFDCFQCNYACGTHKDLFAHKRKFHSKPLLLCIMCKTNFFSYSEMLCHLCPGHYTEEIMFHNVHINYRCCFCRLDSIPSAFRLMVHLRKSHHTCDICLELCTDQQKLSTHLWKHKVNHLCYRCGISYASKPDITKHLFWKHGHESVLCKKCLQKKWPHVYHFCIPPTSFICEECSASFSKAVALKVHKRLHAEEFPYTCSECEKKFISQKLLDRHEERHRNIELGTNGNNEESVCPEDDQKDEIINVTDVVDAKDEVEGEAADGKDEVKEKSHKKHRKDKKDKVVDPYDLPPLNLSSESDSSDEDESPKKPEIDDGKSEPSNEATMLEANSNSGDIAEVPESQVEEESLSVPQKPDTEVTRPSLSLEPSDTTNKPENPINKEIKLTSDKDSVVGKPGNDVPNEVESNNYQIEGIWENFYKTNPTNHNLPYPLCAMKSEVAYGIIMGDHDYCMQVKTDPVIKDDLPSNSNLESGFMEDNMEEEANSEKPGDPVTPGDEKKKGKSPKKRLKTPNDNSSSSSDSSSDSDSSSCTCGTNCSCSSSSSNSSSSSSSDSDSSGGEDKTKQERRKKKKERKAKSKSETPQESTKEDERSPEIDSVPRVPVDPPIQESELDTDESSTDEEFYDKQPGNIANQIIAEKRNQLILSVATPNNGSGTNSPQPDSLPVPPVDNTPVPKSRSKEKKRRRVLPKTKTPPEQHPQLSLSLQTPPVNQFLPSYTDDLTLKPSFQGFNTTPSSDLVYQNTVPSSSTPSNSIPPSPGGMSENDKSRSSKRRRIPNKFYGYSSGDEDEKPTPQKWRKPQDFTPSIPRVQMPPQPSPTPRIQLTVPKQVIRKPSYHKIQKTPKITIAPPIPPSPLPPPPIVLQPPPPPPPLQRPVPDSSETDSDTDNMSIQPQSSYIPPPMPPPPSTQPSSSSKPEKDVYCYCRCPYDEVSEMIACDDESCPIEWFHFECVGILVPPRGQWYCPGCRKARGLPT